MLAAHSKEIPTENILLVNATRLEIHNVVRQLMVRNHGRVATVRGF